MFVRKTLSILILLIPLLWGEILITQVAFGRFGGGRGGFDRGGDWGDRGFAGGDHFGNIDRSYYDHSPESTSAQRPLATDGGLGRVTNYGAARSMAAPVRGTLGVNGVNGDSVRHAYYDRHAFDADWWAHHNNYGWYYPWMGGAYGWGYTSWPMMAGFWGMAAANNPVPYDYGNNITYQGNNVYYGSQSVGTAVQYSEEADKLATLAPVISLPAEAGAPMPKLKPENQKDWKPLGVFSLVQGGQTDSSKLFQIFVNKEGIIHGNYYDMMTDEVKPISGAMDKKSMRAAWKVSGIKDVVYDTGVSNLLKQDSPILIHYGKEKTQQWNLVRLEQPGQPVAKASVATDKVSDPAEAATEKLNKIREQADSTI